MRLEVSQLSLSQASAVLVFFYRGFPSALSLLENRQATQATSSGPSPRRFSKWRIEHRRGEGPGDEVGFYFKRPQEKYRTWTALPLRVVMTLTVFFAYLKKTLKNFVQISYANSDLLLWIQQTWKCLILVQRGTEIVTDSTNLEDFVGFVWRQTGDKTDHDILCRRSFLSRGKLLSASSCYSLRDVVFFVSL